MSKKQKKIWMARQRMKTKASKLYLKDLRLRKKVFKREINNLKELR